MITRLPCPQVIIQHMMNGAVFTNHIMSAYLAFDSCKCLQGLLTTVLCCMVNDNEIGFTHIEIGGSYPFGGIADRILYRVPRQFFPKSLCLFLVTLIGTGIFTLGTTKHNDHDRKNKC